MIARHKRPPRQSDRGKLVSRADDLVRKLVLARDGSCVRCGKTNNLQAAHIKAKNRYGRIRFELLNVIILCVGCHLFWWHKEPIEAAAWLEEKYPGRADLLNVMAATARKVDLKELLIGLRLEVDALNHGQTRGSFRLPIMEKRNGETGSRGEDLQSLP